MRSAPRRDLRNVQGEVLAYCLMDNHFHLLLHCQSGGLSDAMQRLGSAYTRHVNDRVGRDGPLFRGRFHSRLIGDVRYLANVVRYIHRNALVNAVDDPSDQAYQSFGVTELREAVDLAIYQHSSDEFGALHSLPRVLCLLFAQQLPDESAKRLVDDLGLGNPAAFKAAVWRANRHCNDPRVQHLVAVVHRLLATPVAVGV
ncbi:transposase [Ilumatobacter sp.]|uniref:transposase n=1 Tax=Ilumatobacter sp. TaxID=1967498 RepID=UPI0037508970